MGKRRRRNGAGSQARAGKQYTYGKKPRSNAIPVENRSWQPDPRCDQPASSEWGQADDSGGAPELEEDWAWQQEALQAATVQILQFVRSEVYQQCSVTLNQIEKAPLEEAQKRLQEKCEDLQSSLQAEKALRQIEASGFQRSMKEHQELQTSHERQVRELKKKMAKLLEAKARLVTESLKMSAEIEELTANCKAECEKGEIKEAELHMANSRVVILKGSVALLKAQLEATERHLEKKCEELQSSLETEKALRQTEANGFQRTIREQEVFRSSQDRKVQDLRREVAKLLEEKGSLITALQRKTAEAGRLQGANGGLAATGGGSQDAKVKEAELKRKAKRADLLEAVNKELVKKLKGMERKLEEMDAANKQSNPDRGDKKLALLREDLRKEVEGNVALKSELKAERTRAKQEKDELSKKAEANLCYCVERDFSLVMIPCGHCLCTMCWDMLKDRRKHAGLACLTCPVCQIGILKVQRIFKATFIDDAAIV